MHASKLLFLLYYFNKELITTAANKFIFLYFFFFVFFKENKDQLAFHGLHFATHPAFFGSIVYHGAIIYKCQNFLKVIVHMITVDQCNQTACLIDKI